MKPLNQPRLISYRPSIMDLRDARRGGEWMRAWMSFPRTLYERLFGLNRDVLFLWVPKAAGFSVYTTLLKYGCIKDRWETPLAKFKNRGIATFGHVDVLQLTERGVIRREYFERAFKFAFIRNPFDRLVSLFEYLKRIGRPETPPSMTFEDFCRVVGRGEHPPVGLYNYRGLSQCNPMVDWLTDRDGRLIADFIGRFERLREDFEEVCRRIGIREDIPHENRTEHRPYAEYYNAETRAIVERVYRKDLEHFGYTF
jgi:hypothetical protein